jgi:hypothetical protein
MKELSGQLKKALDYEILHFKQGCSYKWITDAG